MSDPVIAMTTTNDEQEAKKLASVLVGSKLAACVQIISKISSVYEWEGIVHCDQEYLLLIKTKDDLVKKVKKSIEANHTYEVPEFLVVPVTDWMDDYIQWMDDVTK